MSGLPPPSLEQERLYQQLHKQYNGKVSAVAGSGKTTAILHLAAHFPGAHIIVFTYNSKLKIETRDRVLKAGINPYYFEVHSYHSFGKKYYTEECITDTGIRHTVDGNLSPLKHLPAYKIYILDEVQDMTPILFKFVLKCVRDAVSSNVSDTTPQIVFLGDERQAIYKYRHSDERYLIYAEQLFQNSLFSDLDWSTVPLSTSFRITSNMATFINTCMLRTKPSVLNAAKAAGDPVYYVIGNNFSAVHWIVKTLRMLNRSGVAFQDMIILAPSVKSLLSNIRVATDGILTIQEPPTPTSTQLGPLASLVNQLAAWGILIHITNDDGENRASADSAEGKLLFTTFHQSKGIERKVVVVFHFNDSYFKYYKWTDDPEKQKASTHTCCNEMYVACTRATETLILVAESFAGEHLPFLDRRQVDALDHSVVRIVNVSCPPERYYDTPPQRNDNNTAAKAVSVTQLLRWLPGHIAQSIVAQLNVAMVRRQQYPTVKLPSHVICEPRTASPSTLFNPPPAASQVFTAAAAAPISPTRPYKESVSDLNGQAIPALYELKLSAVTGRELTMLATLKSELLTNRVVNGTDEVRLNLSRRLRDFQRRVPAISTIEHLLELSSLYDGLLTGYTHKLNQIPHYQWLNNSSSSNIDLSPCVDCLETIIQCDPARVQFEHSLKYAPERFETLDIIGAFDIMTDSTVYEVKCVVEVTDIHFIQLALYAWLWSKANPEAPMKVFQLVNLLTGEVWQINPGNLEVLDDIANQVLTQYTNPPTNDCADEEFLFETQCLVQQYLSPEALAAARTKYDQSMAWNSAASRNVFIRDIPALHEQQQQQQWQNRQRRSYQQHQWRTSSPNTSSRSPNGISSSPSPPHTPQSCRNGPLSVSPGLQRPMTVVTTTRTVTPPPGHGRNASSGASSNSGQGNYYGEYAGSSGAKRRLDEMDLADDDIEEEEEQEQEE